MSTFLENPPDAARVIESLRDTGYNFETAVADLVDNSIAAGADSVDIRVEMDYIGNVHFSIADNGCGMTRDQLVGAMRYGAPQQADPYRLGKFGLGLKTASTAFCRRLEVTTRSSAAAPPVCASWDLDTIAQKNSWALEIATPSEDALSLLENVAGGKSGTVVVWAKMDRFFGRQYKHSAGAAAQKALDKKAETLREHLGVTFQRFLNGTAKQYERVLQMRVNDDPVEPWDPFCSQEQKTESNKFSLEIDIDRGGKVEQAQAVLRTVILPAQSEFSSGDAYKNAKIKQEYQGIYVYRHDRLLTYGSWLDMYTIHPSHNMLRVELSFDYRLDDVFSVPVDKSSIEIDSAFAEELKEKYLKLPIKEAENRRERALRKKQATKGNDMHIPSNQTLQEQSASIKQPDFNVLNAKQGEVEVTNAVGKVRITLPVREESGSEDIFIRPVGELADGVLFEPMLTNGQQGVNINISHEFYRKIYLPNRAIGAAIVGMDSLLWALCVSELNNCTPATATTFREIRFELSRILRRLVEKMPDTVLEADE